MSDLVAIRYGATVGESAVADFVLTTTTDLMTSVGGNLPTMIVGDLFRITGLVSGDAAMNGDYTVLTVNTVDEDYEVVRVDAVAIVTVTVIAAVVTPVETESLGAITNLEKIVVVNMDGADQVYFTIATEGETAPTPTIAGDSVSMPLAKAAGYEHTHEYPTRFDIGTASLKLISQVATEYAVLFYGR